MSILKVAWDNHYVQRDEGGTGVYGTYLLRQFATRQDVKIDVLNGCQRHDRQRGFATRGMRVVRDLFWTHVALPRSLQKREVDLLHAPAFTGPLASPCPVVITLHDITFLLYPSHFRRWWVAYLKALMPSAIRSAAAVICGSEHAKRDIVSTYGIASDKVCVVPYGVDHQRFHPGVVLDAAWGKELGLRDGYVLHVGTLSYRKNIPTLLRAFARLRSLGKGAARQLVLAGQEISGLQGAAEIRETIRQLGLADSVVFTGRVPDERLAGLYARASVFVMPSLYEGFGFPILESMAVGTPVVASSTSSLPEVGGDAAVFIPAMDEHALATAIADIISNPSLTEQLRRKGLRRAQQFSWERAASETIAVYRHIVSGR
jgi:glycosyltransferase involved in cell wall biosynthesis